MNAVLAQTEYLLGSNEAEYERLMRQARTLAPYTERLLLDAGISTGQRVLDVGSGVGDVALLTASLVGATGSVLGIDRDPIALSKARARAHGAHAVNVQFMETDLTNLTIEGEFDAIVGRFVLLFLPDPVATLRALAAHLRPGGIIAFQEPSWASFYALAGHLPLRRACADVLGSTLRLAGAKSDMSLTLYQGLLKCGFKSPQLRIEVPIACDSEGHQWLPDLIATLRPRFLELGVTTDAIAPIDTLATRLATELESACSYAPLLGLAGAWARSTGRSNEPERCRSK